VEEDIINMITMVMVDEEDINLKTKVIKVERVPMTTLSNIANIMHNMDMIKVNMDKKLQVVKVRPLTKQIVL
jgi:hypothetical protein